MICLIFDHNKGIWRKIWKNVILVNLYPSLLMCLCILTDSQFENTQKRKLQQMQSMWLCILTGRTFEEKFENTEQTSATTLSNLSSRQKRWNNLNIPTCRRFEDMFEITQSNKPIWLLIHRSLIWKRTVEKCDYSSFQAFSLRTHFKRQSGEMAYKCNQCDYVSSQAGDLRKHLTSHWRKVK